MATFAVDEFCGSDFGRSELRKLKKEDLLAVAQYCEVDITPETKKPEIVEILISELHLHDPVQERERAERERGREERERERLAREKEGERMFQLELAKVAAMEQEKRLELAKLAFEQEKLKINNSSLQRKHEVRFDVSSCLKLMPKFNRDDVGSFFDAFEKIAKELDWPEDKWALLIQSVLEGRAQEAYAALNASDSREYDTVRRVVLAAYEVVPEAYRQKFRSLQRKASETFLDLARQQEAVFDKWLASTNTYTFQELRQLMLVEQFKISLPRHMEIHLNEMGSTELRKAAMAADSYELTHKEAPWKGKYGFSYLFHGV